MLACLSSAFCRKVLPHDGHGNRADSELPGDGSSILSKLLKGSPADGPFGCSGISSSGLKKRSTLSSNATFIKTKWISDDFKLGLKLKYFYVCSQYAEINSTVSGMDQVSKAAMPVAFKPRCQSWNCAVWLRLACFVSKVKRSCWEENCTGSACMTFARLRGIPL